MGQAVPLVKPIRLHQVLKLELDYVHAQILCNPVQLTLLGKELLGRTKASHGSCHRGVCVHRHSMKPQVWCLVVLKIFAAHGPDNAHGSACIRSCIHNDIHFLCHDGAVLFHACFQMELHAVAVPG